MARVPGKGRGVLAGRDFAEGEVVDAAHVVVVPAREWPMLKQTAMRRFCFVWDDDAGSVAVALGRASLFNHSYSPNVESEKRVKDRLIVFSALRDIEAGEELTLNYNGDVHCLDPVGFEVRDG
ncbi:MAG: SET domain-containing protein-lysine N-methyltransferase [Acidimicrobiales bacterium]